VSVALAAVFQEFAKHPGGRSCPPAELDRRLRELLDACRAAWPGLGVPADAFVRHFAQNLPEDGDLDSCLSRMHGTDLYLAYGCAAGDPTALAAFDGKVLSQTVPVLQRMGISPSQIDEVVQVLRAKLLVADERGLPLMSTYAGRGPLVGWVRTA
jgi:RNA polymerase sigma-70 factor, ECF subfamily